MLAQPRRAAAVLTIGVLAALGACDRGDDVDRPDFDGEAALGYVRQQLAFGPRIPGSEGHRRMGEWLIAEMGQRADTVIEQRWTHVTAAGDSLPMLNVLARFRPEATQRVLYLAHWDTRPISEKAAPGRQDEPVPGANDGASGVALLMGVADQLRRVPPNVGVDLLFVDGEDYGDFGPPLQDVLIGSTYFARNLPEGDYRPLLGVVWDMIGDRDLRIYQEEYSLRAAPEVVDRVWRTAQDLGYGDVFIEQNIGAITDDHVPLQEVGLRVIDVIDLEYPWHHTPDDTIDKVSAESLQIVGEVAMAVLRSL